MLTLSTPINFLTWSYDLPYDFFSLVVLLRKVLKITLRINFQYSTIEWCGSYLAYARECFAAYADTCFASFGDRVKNWITINEPLQTAVNGYDIGIFAPGRCENASVEPYLAAHHQILAHAAAVSIYRSTYKVQDFTYLYTKTFSFEC